MIQTAMTSKGPGGAYLDGGRLRPSAKTDLGVALVATGQATPGEDSDIHRRIDQSVATMLENALVVRVSVPATLQLIHVAAGRMDAFWQYSRVRSGLLAGALLAVLACSPARPAALHPGPHDCHAPGARSPMEAIQHRK